MSDGTHYITVVIRLPQEPTDRAKLIGSLNFGNEAGFMGGTCTGMARGDLMTELDRIAAESERR